MLHKIDTVIVGGGQAGLAISYYLTQEGREHVTLERAPAVANAWSRGSSFRYRRCPRSRFANRELSSISNLNPHNPMGRR